MGMRGDGETPIQRAVRLNAERVTPKVAAQLLGTTTRTLRNWAAQGKGPKPVRIGKRVRYGVADINAWIESAATPGAVCPTCGKPANSGGLAD